VFETEYYKILTIVRKQKSGMATFFVAGNHSMSIVDLR
jgi:hypothetical protein